ncbi:MULTISPECIES: hypothetical protein [Myxococcus]|uniref:hypothetical protein n=1 Tax=Myxococcus TaxID=32 RepID=UPI0013D70467|nr:MULTISPECIES: hypothetical protein [Myxococcus]NVJ24132.1 hypothetical protein [Myxococcus sp. AM011]
MLLTLTTTHSPATDLGYLLHKSPPTPHSFDVSFGQAHLLLLTCSSSRLIFPAMMTCNAAWPNGCCDRDVWQAGLCAGHYMQRRRGKPFASLKGAHGVDPRDLVPVRFEAPRADVEALQAEAKRRDLPEAALHREALGQWVAKLKAEG